MRVYSNYSTEDFNIVTDLAKELGFSTSAFQHYCVMLYADHRGNTSTLNTLISTMMSNLSNYESGETFIVSALLPNKWSSLSRSEKMTLAKQLAHHVKLHSNQFAPYKIAKGKTTVYRRV